MIRFFIKKDFAAFKNYIRKNNSRKLIFLSFLLIILLFSSGLYLGSFKFFSYLNSYTEVGELVARVILGYSIFLVFILMIPSYLFSSLTTSFYDKSYAFIITSPIPIKKVYRALYFKSYLIGFWPVLLIAVPLLLSYTIAFDKNISQILISLDAIIALTFISYGIGFLLNVILQISGLTKKRLFWIISTIVIVISLPYFIDSLVPAKLHQLYFTKDLNSLSQEINNLPVLNKLLPSTWVTNVITGYMTKINITILYTLSLFVAVSSFFLGEKVFYSNWQSAQENNFIASNTTTQKSKSLELFSTQNISVGLIVRFITSFTRNPNQISSMMFLFILSVISVLLLQNLAPFKDTETAIFKNLITFSFMTISFIITIICLKFIFPLPQNNLRDHLIITSPMPATKLYKSFTIYSVICAILFGLMFSLPMLITLQGVYSQFRLIFLLITIFTSLILAFLTLVIGTMASDAQSKYSEDDITTSPKGIITTIIAIVIIGMIAMSLNNILSLAWTPEGVTNTMVFMEAMPVLGIVILMGIISWYGGIKLLKRKVSI